MRQLALVIALLILAAACKTPAVADFKAYRSDAEVPRISLEDAKKEFDAGTAVIVDSRADVAYKQEHIAGAINVPIGSPEGEFDKIPRGKKIIVYCS